MSAYREWVWSLMSPSHEKQDNHTMDNKRMSRRQSTTFSVDHWPTTEPSSGSSACTLEEANTRCTKFEWNGETLMNEAETFPVRLVGSLRVSKAKVRMPAEMKRDGNFQGSHPNTEPYSMLMASSDRESSYTNHPHHERIPVRACLSSLGPNLALILVLIASSYNISRYRLQEPIPEDRSGENILNVVAVWEPSSLQFYSSCGIWAVTVVLWVHKHRNEGHRTLVVACGILCAIGIGATFNMSLEQMGRQAMPWCVIVSLFLSAMVRLTQAPVASSEEGNLQPPTWTPTTTALTWTST